MTISYTWLDAEQTSLRITGTGSADEVMTIPADPANRHYAEFLRSGATASPYVAPPEPEPLTAQQKLENSGLTVDELKELLGI